MWCDVIRSGVVRSGVVRSSVMWHDFLNCGFVSLSFAFCLQHLSRAKESLCQLRYHREAVKVMMKHASIKRVFAKDSENTEEKHEHLLEVGN